MGAGQIGTTIGQALMVAGPGWGVLEVGLLDRDPHISALAVELGGGHRVLTGVDQVLAADIIILAVPVSGIVAWIEQWGPRLSPGSLLLDTGSSKATVVAAMRQGIPAAVAAVGGHPICGSESNGPASARREVLLGAPFVLTPVRSDAGALERASRLVECLGAVPLTVDAAFHDRVVARSSHLPHLLAGALAQLCVRAGTDMDSISALLGPGFRGATRLAVSDPEMVASFLAANSAEVASALEELVAELLRLGEVLSSGSESVAEFLQAGAEARSALLGSTG